MKLLEWDTKFWNKDVYIIEGEEEIEIDFPKESVIQYKTEISNIETIRKLEKNGFGFVELSMTFVYDSQDLKFPLVDGNISKAELDDICKIRDILDNSFNQSRFNIFGKERVNEFYKIWAENAIKSIHDDFCLKYEEDDCIKGIITGKIFNDNSENARIGLVCVGNNFKGKGIGTILINHSKTMLKNLGVRNIFVVTQGSNYTAHNLYIKTGFSLNKIESWYYKLT